MIYCSFCGKNEQDGVKLLTGPCVFICSECVFLAVSILETEFGVTNPDVQTQQNKISKQNITKKI